MAGNGASAFGSCCAELKEIVEADDFDPLISVGDNDVLYMSIGLVEGEDGDSSLIDHPVFFCPFCGKGLQTQDEVQAKIGDDD